MSTLKYRPEIDGLRALAVLPVVIYHIKSRYLPGGFLGVDVFFVISGFLITSVILRELDCGNFSFKNFWLRRIRRLFPALAFMLCTCLIAGFFLLYSVEWESLCAQTAAVLLMVGNFKMWAQTGYWGPAAEDIPLLHCWSLAVEEQF